LFLSDVIVWQLRGSGGRPLITSRVHVIVSATTESRVEIGAARWQTADKAPSRVQHAGTAQLQKCWLTFEDLLGLYNLVERGPAGEEGGQAVLVRLLRQRLLRLGHANVNAVVVCTSSKNSVRAAG
jgi:hypothetical protein